MITAGSACAPAWWRERRRGRCATRWRTRCGFMGCLIILTDNGKVFTARFGRGPGPVLFDRICAENGVRHLLTAPYSPTTTGKVERFHKTMRAEWATPTAGSFATIVHAQAALDVWVAEYTPVRPHQSVGAPPPVERFALAARGPALV